MDAGGTKLLAGVVDEDGDVLFRTVRSWPRETTREDVLLRFETAIREAREHSEDVDAIGAAIPANVDVASGTAVSSRHLPLAGFAFRDWLAETTGLEAYVDNDAVEPVSIHLEVRRSIITDVDLQCLGVAGAKTKGNLVARGATPDDECPVTDIDGHAVCRLSRLRVDRQTAGEKAG